MRRLKRFLVVLLILIAAFFIYVEIANRNSKHMTYRQKVLKAVYPALMWWTKIRGKNRLKLSNEDRQPPVSFYSLRMTGNNGADVDFSQFRGKKVMLVNTASDCGYTDQYNELQKLYDANKDKLVILGFPANDFKEQEKGSDEQIAQFCKLNYGVTFPLMKKSQVISGAEQNPVFQWLTDPAKNGWNRRQPSWNFCKYLVDENGVLIRFFASSVSPLSSDITDLIK